MVIVKTIDGNLLEAEEDIICQQCNCVTMIPHGLSKSIAIKYPWANVYAKRTLSTRNCTENPSIPGTIEISKEGEKSVIHLYGQYLPAKPGVYSMHYRAHPGLKDSAKDRENYFQLCLIELDALELKEAVAMPYLIGCGLAGGNWLNYKTMLEACDTKIILYKL